MARITTIRRPVSDVPIKIRLRHTRTLRALHWSTAALIVVLFGLGWTMVSLAPSPKKIELYAAHKWLGVLVFTLTLLRLAWRLRHPGPEASADTPRSLVVAAKATHGALYGLLIGLPVVGWALSAAAGFPVTAFGFSWSGPIAPGAALAETLKALHKIGGWALLLILGLHVAAALWHHLVRRDDVLRAMLAGGRASVRAETVAILLAAAALGVPALAPPASAAADPWRVDAARSELTFTAAVMSAPLNGRFERWSASIVFDPRAPQDARLRVEIDMASVATANIDVNRQLPLDDWFAAGRFSTALFESTSFEPVGEGRYRVPGMLTMRGITMPLALSVEIAIDETHPEGPRATARGTASIARGAFGVGQGAWARANPVSNEVAIAFSIVASSARRGRQEFIHQEGERR